jgi:hypothetical protein
VKRLPGIEQEECDGVDEVVHVDERLERDPRERDGDGGVEENGDHRSVAPAPAVGHQSHIQVLKSIV